jgi:hypothetical protein
VNGILSWLDKYFTIAGQTIDRNVSNVVHWALRAITALVFGQFRNTSAAWVVYYSQTNYFSTCLRELSTATRGKHQYTLKVRVPALQKWALGNFAHGLAALAALAAAVARDVTALGKRITAGLAALSKWVLTSVWAPLDAAIKETEANLVKWGWTAWWWITHLDKLADAMIFDIAASLEKNAWHLAAILGQFVTALILRNALRVAQLAESIVVAVF